LTKSQKHLQEVVEGAKNRCLHYIGIQNVVRVEMQKNGWKHMGKLLRQST